MRIHEGWLRRGRWWALGGVGLAIALTAWVLESGTDPASQWRSIREAIEQERWDEAEGRLARWLERSPSDGNAWVLSGSLLGRRGRFDEARAAFGRVRPADPSWPEAQTRIGEMWLRRDRIADAERAFRTAARDVRRAIDPRARLVYILIVQDRPEEARAILWELYDLTRDIRHLVALVGLAGVEADSDPRSLEPDLDRFLRQTPEDVWLRRARGLMSLRQGRPAEALPHLDAAVPAVEEDPVGTFARAECRIALGRTEGLDALLGSPPLRPRDRRRWWSLKGRAAQARGQEEQALWCWREAVVADPEDRLARYQLGQALVRRGEVEEARPHLDRAAAIALREDRLKSLLYQLSSQRGGGVELFEALGELCRESGLPDEARAWYQQAISLDPTSSVAQSSLAKLAGRSTSTPVPPRLRVARAPIPRTGPSVATRPSKPRFEEVSGTAGVRYRYDCGETGRLSILEVMGGGVGLIDYDEDGWLDLYLVNGCPLPVAPKNPPAANKMYRNRGDGTFEDVTDRAGVGGRGYGMGCAVADYDNDGHDDLLVTAFRDTVLYRNRGDGTFEDVTDRAGVRSSRWCTAAGFGDLDGDGDLDLVVVTYVDADPGAPPCRDASGRPMHCPPGNYPAQFDHLYRNNGDGTFTDVARAAGLEVPDGVGLGLAIADFDGDDRLDFYVANDAVPDFLFCNRGGLRFEEVGVAAGLAYDGQGRSTASMGVVADDLDGDGLIDLFHTNFINEGSTLARNLGGGLFADVTARAGLDAPSRPVTGFGTAALDVDNDGRLDLFVANGHVDHQPWQGRPMAQLPHLYMNVAEDRFELAAAAPRAYFTRPVVGRGVAAGDLDNDGRLDLVIVHRDAPLTILRNTSDAGHCLGLRLRGTASGATPVGARVTCRVGSMTLVRRVTSGTGYLSAHDPRLWFGLGASASVDSLEVRWPSGLVQEWSAVVGDRILEIREGHEPTEAIGRLRR